MQVGGGIRHGRSVTTPSIRGVLGHLGPGIVPGIVLAVCIALVSELGGHYVPIVGAPVFAIIIGLLLRNALGMPEMCGSGVKFASKTLLQAGIVLLGFGVNLHQLWTTGSHSFLVMIGTLCVGLVGGLAIGKLLGIDFGVRSLVSVGTSICGASAIAAVSPIVGAEAIQIAYSISTIFLFNVVAVLSFPAIGHLLHMSSDSFGIWAGTAINDTSSVVAAGYSYNDAAGITATIVKLTRTIMIIPVSLLFAGYMWFSARRRNGEGGQQIRLLSVVPWFIFLFLAASIIRTAEWIPTAALSNAATIGQFLIVVALAGVGLGSNLGELRHTGLKPIYMGTAVWALVAASSLAIQHITGI